jgi:DNA-binding protein HU-beta
MALFGGQLGKNRFVTPLDLDMRGSVNWRPRMNNADLAEALATEHGLTKADARKYVDGVFAAITEAAAKGEEVSLNGFGKFKVKDSPAREGRNPANGQTIQIAASKKLAFTPAKAVKDRLNG